MEIYYEVKLVWNKGSMVLHDTVYTDSNNYISELKETVRKTYFSFMPEVHLYWEVLKWDVSFGYNSWYDALPAEEIFETYNMTKQQLHYYVKTGQIRKEYDPTGVVKRARYNKNDVLAVYANIIKIHTKGE